MIQLNATEARRKFFKLLDSAARGEKVVIDRKGVPLEIVRRPSQKWKRKNKSIPDYRKYFHSPVDNADKWTWEWSPGEDLKLIDRSDNSD